MASPGTLQDATGITDKSDIYVWMVSCDEAQLCAVAARHSKQSLNGVSTAHLVGDRNREEGAAGLYVVVNTCAETMYIVLSIVVCSVSRTIRGYG